MSRFGPSQTRSATLAFRHVAASAFGAVFWLVFAIVNLRYSIESGRVIGLGVGLLGIWSAVLFCVRRPPSLVSRSVPVWIAAYLGTFGASLLRPGGPHSGWLDTGGLFLQGIGIVVGVVSLATLGRSLGLVPAHRGLGHLWRVRVPPPSSLCLIRPRRSRLPLAEPAPVEPRGLDRRRDVSGGAHSQRGEAPWDRRRLPCIRATNPAAADSGSVVVQSPPEVRSRLGLGSLH